MTTEVKSPLVEFHAQLETLKLIAARLIDPNEHTVMWLAIRDFKNSREQRAQSEETRLHTRHFCGICFNPIPYGDDVRLRGDSQGRRAHKSCEHLNFHDMADCRKRIKTGKLHEPGSCFYKDKCPLFQHIPTMSEKPPAAWKETV